MIFLHSKFFVVESTFKGGWVGQVPAALGHKFAKK